MGPIVVFTPTLQPGGLDVNYASCARQTLAKEIVWLVADELLEQRARTWETLAREQKDLRGIEVFRVEGKYERTLALSYKQAMKMAREWEAVLFVSLQDYFWAPPDGVEKFLVMAAQRTNTLLTGHASIADNPGPEAVENVNGAYTIFKEPFYGKPRETFWWSECRGQGETGWYTANPIEWELNWAAIPNDVLMLDVDFDPEFDKGISCENQDYALECLRRYDTEVITDASNHALGLPHKLYFPERTQINADVVPVNRKYMEEKWGIPA